MHAIKTKKKPGMIKITLLLAVMTTIAALSFIYGSASRTQTVSELTVGVLPDQEPEVLRRRYQPLIDYLGQYLGIDVRLVIPNDYADAVGLFQQKKLDLAYLGGLTFVHARNRSGAEPLVMREVDTRFTSWFLVKPDLAQTRLSELRDKKLVFGNRLSTSGHLMPRYYLQQQWNIEPEKFFTEVSYSGAHDKTINLVREGRYEIGAVNSGIARQMLLDGRLEENELEVLWQTPPYSDYVWAVPQELDEEVKIDLRDAFLRLDSENPEDKAILSSLGASAFLPAGVEDFNTLSDIAINLGLVTGEAQ